MASLLSSLCFALGSWLQGIYLSPLSLPELIGKDGRLFLPRLLSWIRHLAWWMSSRCLRKNTILRSAPASPKAALPAMRLCLVRGSTCLLIAPAPMEPTAMQGHAYSASAKRIASAISCSPTGRRRLPSGIRRTAQELTDPWTRILRALCERCRRGSRYIGDTRSEVKP